MGDRTASTDVAILEGVLAGTTSIIAGAPVRAGRTPCPEFDVVRLTNHLVGFLRRFETILDGRPVVEDAATYVAGDEPAAEFAEAAAGVAKAWRVGDPDAQLVLTVGPIPRSLVYNVMLLEYVVHGWDLARATGQSIPFTTEQTSTALRGSSLVVQPQYRGEGRNFGPEVPVPPDASALDRLVGFTGRDPRWLP